MRNYKMRGRPLYPESAVAVSIFREHGPRSPRGAADPEVHGEGAPRDAPPDHLDLPEDSRATKREALVSCVPSWADARSFGVATQGSWSPFGLPTVNEASLRPHR